MLAAFCGSAGWSLVACVFTGSLAGSAAGAVAVAAGGGATGGAVSCAAAVGAGADCAGAAGVGAPVRNHAGEVVAALTISGPESRFTEENIQRFSALVTRAAAGNRIDVQLTFTSVQRAGEGPAARPQETCTDWSLNYVMRPANGLWLIDQVLATGTASAPCAVRPGATPRASATATGAGEGR